MWGEQLGKDLVDYTSVTVLPSIQSCTCI